MPYENAVRVSKKQPTLDTVPTINSLDDIIPFCDDICRVALPYGLASQFFVGEDNTYMAQEFRARFIAALEDVACIKEESVVDNYA